MLSALAHGSRGPTARKVYRHASHTKCFCREAFAAVVCQEMRKGEEEGEEGPHLPSYVGFAPEKKRNFFPLLSLPFFSQSGGSLKACRVGTQMPLGSASRGLGLISRRPTSSQKRGVIP